jgi:L-fuconolactonase
VIIDAHHHLWRFDAEEYAWIGPQDSMLRRDFLADELQQMATGSGLAGTVVVQARQSLAETRWLLDLARQHPLIRGVVGWVPLADPALPAVLDALPPGRLVGVRHVVQGEADPEFLLRPELQRGLIEIGRRDLTYDILITAPQLPQAIRAVERLPTSQRFLLDHGGKPAIRARGHAAWAADLRRLAAFPNVACKLSGLVTEADPQTWTPAELEPFVRTILEVFGPQRVLFGSDWPVCLLGTAHQVWLAAVCRWISGYSAADQAAILGVNAVTWYRLEPS